MELLYVVELDVRPSELEELKSADMRERVLAHVAEWLSFEHTPQLSAESFKSAGTAALSSDRDDCRRSRYSPGV